jgi:hypothetical protein
MRGKSPGSPLASCYAEIKLARTRDEILNDCLAAMASMRALSPAGGSEVERDERQIRIQGGTRGWATRHRGNQIKIVIESGGERHKQHSVHKVLISSDCYRPEILSQYKVRRDVRNILSKILKLKRM